MIDTKAIRAKVLDLALNYSEYLVDELGSIVKSISTKPFQILESEVLQQGTYKVISQSKEFSIGYTNDITKVYHHDKPIIVFGDHTTVVKYTDFDFVVGADGIKILEPDYNLVDTKYLYYTMQFNLLNFIESGGYARHYRYVKKFPIPIPTLPEQRRIVAKIDTIFSTLDTLDTLQSQYQDNLATLKSKIIDAGIQGKLTKQLQEDGTAEELYQQIQKERFTLEKTEKSKKTKPLQPISEEEKPFDIPENWKWVRLEDVYEINPKVTADNNIDAAFIPMERISAGFDRSFSYEVKNWTEASKNHTRFCNGDVAFAKISPCFENRKSFVADNLPNSIGGGTTELIILRQKLIDPLFTYYLILDERFIRLGLSTYKGTVGQQRIKNDVMFSYVFPLPPLAEQKRIVAKLEELLLLCEE